MGQLRFGQAPNWPVGGGGGYSMACEQPMACWRLRPTPEGGGSGAKKKVCVPKNGLQFWAPLINFIFSGGKFSDVGGWVGQAEEPGLPFRPPGATVSHGLPAGITLVPLGLALTSYALRLIGADPSPTRVSQRKVSEAFSLAPHTRHHFTVSCREGRTIIDSEGRKHIYRNKMRIKLLLVS